MHYIMFHAMVNSEEEFPFILSSKRMLKASLTSFQAHVKLLRAGFG